MPSSLTSERNPCVRCTFLGIPQPTARPGSDYCEWCLSMAHQDNVLRAKKRLPTYAVVGFG